ncbi:benzoate 1,2-dioxygenase electron transfer component BenC [Granulicoccus phenolivorans]|uniref:benzoate 1,2-dioxygenase electron transfer component BenC n=1 Tax=Granulicoccus phenolivorans TaxID=266854 RepID=UPI000479DDC3|nr:benzoate 1,2-dioxygenase electron transfer component BenC [Granulicoccus phenolivorans]
MTDYKVALSFEDGVTRFINVADDQTVADAAYRQRINIPVDCNDGACGTCKAFCESGEFDPGSYVEDALSAEEAAEGYVLACQARPKSDMVLQIACTSAVAKTQSATFTGTLTEVHHFSPTVTRLRMKIPNRDKLAYLPGQYVNITIPGSDETRSYSFSSAPDSEELEFLIKIVPGGLCSEWASKVAKVGDEVTFNGPHGSFFLRETNTPLLMVAGGTGLAPILAMLRSMEAHGSPRTVHMVYGVNTDGDVVEIDELERLTSKLSNFTWDYVVTDPNTTAKNVGFVMSIISDTHLHSGDAAIYLCGPPPMVEAVRTHVKDLGVEPNGFYYEKFTSASAPKVAAVAEPTADELVEAQQTVGAPLWVPATREIQYAGAEARGVMGQSMFPEAELAPASGGGGIPDGFGMRDLMGQEMYGSQLSGETTALAPNADVAPVQGSRTIMGEEMFPAAEITSVGGDQPAGIAAHFVPGAADLTTDGYEIGEEHPPVTKSDAIFEARRALELGALELVMGRINSQQVAGYRMLAEATLPYVKGDQFVDAMAYTETNAAFHDYLFTLTGNDHLRQAYTRLGVKGEMESTLKNAHWCHPLVAKDHVDMVNAIEAGDRERTRQLFIAHAERSQMTMRRAMADQQARTVSTTGRFTGKAVLITGAAQGIGEAVARRIHAEGGELLLVDRSELVENVAAGLDREGAHAQSQLADMETFEGAQAAVDACIRRFGRVDIAIHVVGGTIWRKPFEEYAPDEIEKEIRRSLFPTLYSCRAVLPEMYAAGQGTIVNVGSVATTGLNRLPYAAAKGGVAALTRSLAWEAAKHGVRVVATAPGGTEAPPRRVPRGGEPTNPQQEAWHQVTVDQTIESSLLKRYGTLEEQAAAICFLASDEASYITGTTLPVAGGDLG